MLSQHIKGCFARSSLTSKASLCLLSAGGNPSNHHHGTWGLPLALPITTYLNPPVLHPCHPGSAVLMDPPALIAVSTPCTLSQASPQGHPPWPPPSTTSCPAPPLLLQSVALPGYRRLDSLEQVWVLSKCLLTDESVNMGDQRKGPGGRREAKQKGWRERPLCA